MRQHIQPNGFDFYAATSESTLQNYLSYITAVTGASSFLFEITSTRSDFRLITGYPSGAPVSMNFTSETVTTVDEEVAYELSPEFNPSPVTSVVGNLTVRFSDLITYRSAGNAPAFQMRLNARTTEWQYYIIPGEGGTPDHPTITGKDGLRFAGPEPVTTVSDEKAMLFTSYELLPLSEAPRYKLDLVSDPLAGNFPNGPNRNEKKILFKGLPNPGTEFYAMASDGSSDRMVSPMYVYL
ncbi:MAG: hypothetical protein IM638_07795 [Bacteroidetes bacterium]|nr:hypothetical protein [Bacteroidota bacterium]